MGGLIKLIVAGLTLLIMAGMVVIMYFISLPGHQPDDIKGREAILSNKKKSSNLFDDLELAVDTQKKFTLTEEQVNHYLASQLNIQQGGKLKQFLNINLSIKGVWVKFSPDIIDFYVEREVKWGGGTNEQGEEIPQSSQDHITKYSVEITTTEDKSGTISINMKPLGGKVGGMPTPGLFATFAKAPIDKIQQVLDKEVKLLKEMSRVTVKQGSIEMIAKPNVIVKPAPSKKKK